MPRRFNWDALVLFADANKTIIAKKIMNFSLAHQSSGRKAERNRKKK
jgi:hypothetical protein